MKSSNTASTYERYRIKALKLDKLAEFIRLDNRTVDTIRIDGVRYRMSKSNGAIIIEPTELQD